MGQMVVVPRQARRTHTVNSALVLQLDEGFLCCSFRQLCLNARYYASEKGNNMDSEEEDNDPREGAWTSDGDWVCPGILPDKTMVANPGNPL